MFINEVEEGSRVEICAMIGSNKLEFETEAVRGLTAPQNALLVNPMLKDGKLLNFHVGGLVCQAVIQNKEDNKPYLWKGIAIRSIKNKNGECYHVLFSPNEGLLHNRRESYRVWLGFHADAKIGVEGKPHSVTVRDISATGVGFICEAGVEVNEGIPVHLSFADDIKGTKFDLKGKVVRKEELEDGRNLYGCRLNAESPQIQKYVNEKQIQKARNVGNMDRRMAGK